MGHAMCFHNSQPNKEQPREDAQMQFIWPWFVAQIVSWWFVAWPMHPNVKVFFFLLSLLLAPRQLMLSTYLIIGFWFHCRLQLNPEDNNGAGCN
jgi:hypothetical protein